MSRAYVAGELRQRIAAQARHRCGYCLMAESVVGMPMEIDHIIPESLGGETAEENLWLACPLCNAIKSNRVAGTDEMTGQIVPLFDPRRQLWNEHFRWSDDESVIIGQTPIGRATVATLRLNRGPLVIARGKWVVTGWHPPRD